MGVSLPALQAWLCGWPGSCTRAMYVYANSIAIICLLSPGCLGFCCQRLREACGCRDPSGPCFTFAWFAPVSHHCFWRSLLTGNERFILSGLNYIVPPDCWCYFTLNNTTWSSQSAQGQSLRVIDTSEAGRELRRGGAGNQDLILCGRQILPVFYKRVSYLLWNLYPTPSIKLFGLWNLCSWYPTCRNKFRVTDTLRARIWYNPFRSPLL